MTTPQNAQLEAFLDDMRDDLELVRMTLSDDGRDGIHDALRLFAAANDSVSCQGFSRLEALLSAGREMLARFLEAERPLTRAASAALDSLLTTAEQLLDRIARTGAECDDGELIVEALDRVEEACRDGETCEVEPAVPTAPPCVAAPALEPATEPTVFESGDYRILDSWLRDELLDEADFIPADTGAEPFEPLIPELPDLTPAPVAPEPVTVDAFDLAAHDPVTPVDVEIEDVPTVPDVTAFVAEALEVVQAVDDAPHVEAAALRVPCDGDFTDRLLDIVSPAAGQGIPARGLRKLVREMGGDVAASAGANGEMEVSLQWAQGIDLARFLFVRVGREHYAIPEDDVLGLAVARGDSVTWGEQELAVIDLGIRLGAGPASEALKEIVIVETSDGPVGLLVDEAEDTGDAVVRPLSPLLAGVELVRAAAVDASRRPTLILETRRLGGSAIGGAA